MGLVRRSPVTIKVSSLLCRFVKYMAKKDQKNNKNQKNQKDLM